MPQITIHVSDEMNEAGVTQKALAGDILSKHGLSLNPMNPSPGGSPPQPYHSVVVSDPQKANDIVAELQSNGISAFVKPQASAP